MSRSPFWSMLAAAPGWTLVAMAATLSRGADDPLRGPPEVVVTVELTTGSRETGTLTAIDGEEIRIVSEGTDRAFAVADVRTLVRSPVAAAHVPVVSLIGVDGTRLSGLDLTWEGETVSLVRPEGSVTLPVSRVRTIIWNRSAATPASPDDPEWFASLPAELESDLVVVEKGDGTQFVPCAITAISPETVTVNLDGETIAVNRNRIVGLHWLREPITAAGIGVQVSGGALRASRVAWSPAALIVDDVRLPAVNLESIDYAAGRTVRLATLPTERVTVEPFFGSLAEIDGLARYFQPRVVHADGAAAARDLVLRPRTQAVWRVPAGSRMFSTTVSASGNHAGGSGLVTITIDDTEVFRGSVGPPAAGGVERASIGPLPLTDARRLSVTVDYGTAGPVGGVVVFHDPVFER